MTAGSELDRPRAGATAGADRAWGWWPARPSPWARALAIAVGTRLVLGLVAWVGAWYLAGGAGVLETGPLELWRQWDADIYLDIAARGYHGPGVVPFAEAFFPLFPLLLRPLLSLGVPAVAAGLLVTTAATTVALAHLIQLADEELGEGAGHRAGLYLCLFPTAVFLVAPYSEAVFLAGAVPAFRMARRGRPGLAGLGAAVAMGSRLAGVFVLAGLAATVVHATTRARSHTRAGRTLVRGGAGLLIGVSPLVAYAGWLWAVRSDPLYFLTAQRLGWGRELVGPVDSFLATWETWGSGAPTAWLLAWRVEVLAALVGAAAVAWAARRREWGYAVYMGATLAALTSSTWYLSIPRALLTFFPLMLFLADWAGRGPRRHEVLLVSLAPLAALGAVVFTQGRWLS